MARTGISRWNILNTYITPDGSYDILINGSNHYLNFGTLSGSSGYGIRDNGGTIQFKDSGGAWADIGSGSGATAFTDLTDVPASYAGASLKAVRVNVGETGLEFYTPSGGTVGPGTINEIAYFDSTNTITSLAVATYPSLTELSYVKGVTSAIQTQLNAKQASDAGLTSLAGLTYVSPSFVKMTGADTFSLDTNTYLTSLSGAVLTDQTVGQTIGDTTNRLTKLWATDITVTNAISGSITGNAGTVTNATLTTALTVNTGTVTLTGNVANTSVLTIGAGAVSVSGSNTGDQTLGSLGAAASATTITIAGTANQITSSAGAQDLSANRTWTLSLPADVLIPTVLTVPNTGLHLLDSDASHDLIIKPGSNLTADKTLTITTGDADVTLNLTAVTDEYLLAYDTGTNTWRGVAPSGGGQTLYEAVVATSGGDYTTLGAALTAGKTRIFIRNGTYTELNEPLIPSSCVITGESRDGVILNVSSTTNNRIKITPGAISKVQISNLTIKSTSATDFVLDQGSAAGDSLVDSIFENVLFEKGGFRCGYPDNNTSTNLRFTNCGITGLDGAGAWGILVRGNGTITTGYIEVIGLQTYGTMKLATGGSIIELECPHLVVNIVGNNFYMSTSAALETYGVKFYFNTTASKVSIVGNAFQGIGSSSGGGAIYTSPHSIISGNVFRANYIGIVRPGIGSVITGNVFEGGTNTDIDGSTADVVVSGNIFKSYTTAINGSGARWSITGNKFYTGTTSIGSSVAVTTNIDDSNMGLLPSEIRKLSYVKNTSGGALAAGDVVILKAVAAGNEITTTTTAGDNKVYGMAVEAISDNAFGLIQTLGKTVALKVNGTTDIAVGDYLTCYTTAKIAAKAVAGDMVFAMALEAYTTNDSNGVIDALLINPRLI